MGGRTPVRILLLVVVIRLVLGVEMWGARRVFPADPPTITMEMYKGVALEINPWLEPWQRWDAPQYQAISERGYGAFSDALFTPPLFPLLMSLTTPLFGGNDLLAGMVISSLAIFLCLIVLEKLVRHELGSSADSNRAVLFLISFPAAFFLFAAYTESLFLLAAVACMYAARRERWIQAGIFGALAALTRAPGFLISIPLVYAAWQAWKKGDRKGWLSVAITLLGYGLFPLYVLFGLHISPMAILSAVGRGGSLSFPGWNLVVAFTNILHGQLVQENLTELVFTLLFIYLTVFVYKKLPTLFAVYSITFMGLFLTRLGSPQPLVSMVRYVLEIFPAFILLAVWGRKAWVYRLVLYLSWLGLLFFAAQFAIWGWVG